MLYLYIDAQGITGIEVMFGKEILVYWQDDVFFWDYLKGIDSIVDWITTDAKWYHCGHCPSFV